MKTLLQTLTRYKTSTILNIVGLSIAFAAFIVLAMQIRYDLTYDKHNENYDSLYQLSAAEATGPNKLNVNWSRPFSIDLAGKFQGIETMTLVGEVWGGSFTIKGDENISGTEQVTTCNGTLTDIFSFEFVEGDPNSLAEPNNYIVSQAFVQKYFQGKSPIGSTIETSKGNGTITAVFKTHPKNGTMTRDIYTNIGKDNVDNYSNWNYVVYLTLAKNTDIKKLTMDINAFMAEKSDMYYTENLDVILTPMADIRYDVNNQNRGLLYVMIAAALLITVLAFINFVNFTVAMVPIKIKAINLRKVVGASQTQLRANVICEVLTLVFLSLLLSFLLVNIFRNSPFSSIISDASFDNNIIVYIVAVVLSLFSGAVAGLYPAFYSTSFQPALVLKNSYALGTKGTLMRKLLIGFQFFVAISFIAGSIFIQQQHSYMLDKDRGYSKEDIIHVSHGGSFNKHEVLSEELKSKSFIKDVTFSGYELGASGSIQNWTRPYSKGSFELMILPVSYNFLNFFDIDLLKGRDFIKSDNNNEGGCYMMSKMAMDKYEFEFTEKILGNTYAKRADVVGVCENVYIRNMKEEQKPFALYLNCKRGWSSLLNSYIKISEDAPDNVFETITEAYKKVDPTAIIQANYFTERDEFFYQEDNNTKKMMQGFSLVAIAIALVGVFGLVAFDTRFRRKEIGIRRVHGATIKQIILMFGLSYIGIIIISFALSVPLVYYGITIWLESFPYKIEIAWWVFALALLLVVLLTLAISITQSYKAANENPVKSLKSE